jgi:hypothetical protein
MDYQRWAGGSLNIPFQAVVPDVAEEKYIFFFTLSLLAEIGIGRITIHVYLHHT